MNWMWEGGDILNIEALYERYHIYSTYQSVTHVSWVDIQRSQLESGSIDVFSGKVVLTGARSLDDIDEGWAVIYNLLKWYVVRRQ